MNIFNVVDAEKAYHFFFCIINKIYRIFPSCKLDMTQRTGQGVVDYEETNKLTCLCLWAFSRSEFINPAFNFLSSLVSTAMQSDMATEMPVSFFQILHPVRVPSGVLRRRVCHLCHHCHGKKKKSIIIIVLVIIIKWQCCLAPNWESGSNGQAQRAVLYTYNNFSKIWNSEHAYDARQAHSMSLACVICMLGVWK